MFNMCKLFAVVAFCALYFPVQTAAPDPSVTPVVLQKNEGEVRTRRPREGVPVVSTEFMLKIGPKANGSRHLLVLTENIHPGAVIPRHRHHDEDEILLMETGHAHVWLGDKEYDADAGSLVFIPAETWISLKNTGTTDISLVAVWNEPGFEGMLLCGSTPKGQTGERLSRDEVRDCYHHGDSELEAVEAQPGKK